MRRIAIATAVGVLAVGLAAVGVAGVTACFRQASHNVAFDPREGLSA